MSGLYLENMGKASVCPVCEKPVGSEKTVYTINEQDYHPECYEKRRADLAKPERDDRD